jgi:Ca-activated chloride channel family protein
MRLRRFSLALGLMLLGLGMAGPQWGRDWGQSAAPGRDLMVVVDCSRSMLAETPSRLARARLALLDLVQALQKRGGDRVGLVVFAGKAKLLCPLTHEFDHFRTALENLEIEPFDPDLGPGAGSGGAPEDSGTRIGLGIHEAIRFHGKHLAARDILLLSDGDDPARDGEWQYGIDEAREQGIPVFTIGLGDPDEPALIRIAGKVQKFDGQEVKTRLEEAPLREIAQQTGGRYIAARTRALPLGEVYLDLAAGKERRDQSDDLLPVYRQRYPLFLLPALALLLLTMVLPEQGSKSRALG